MMNLRQMVLVDLQAWCEAEKDVGHLADRIANQLESGHGRADCALSDGQLSWAYDEAQRLLTVRYPNGAERTRQLLEPTSPLS